MKKRKNSSGNQTSQFYPFSHTNHALRTIKLNIHFLAFISEQHISTKGEIRWLTSKELRGVNVHQLRVVRSLPCLMQPHWCQDTTQHTHTRPNTHTQTCRTESSLPAPSTDQLPAFITFKTDLQHVQMYLTMPKVRSFSFVLWI